MSDIISGCDLIGAVVNDAEVSMKKQGHAVAYTEEELQKIAEMQLSAMEGKR